MAITKGAICGFSGSDTSATSITSASFDSTGGGLIVFGVAHEGAPTTYTFSDNKGNTSWATPIEVDHSNNDLSTAVSYHWAPAVGTGHTVTVTLGATKPHRYIGGLVINGTFASAAILAATTQTGTGTGLAVDAGSLVTDAAAMLVFFHMNYNARPLLPGSYPGWTLDDNAVAGRSLMTRNESAAGTFNPALSLSGADAAWNATALAFKEAEAVVVMEPTLFVVRGAIRTN